MSIDDFGLFDEGLRVMRLPDIRAEINQVMLRLFGPTIDLTDESVEGQAIGIVSERFAKLWALVEVLAGSIDPNVATRALLDALCAITGTFRRPPTFSLVDVILTGSAATVVPGDSQVSTGVEAGRFVTMGDATLVAAPAWADIEYAVGSIITSGGQIYYCFALAPVGLGAPTAVTRNGAILPGSPETSWIWLGAGTAYAAKQCHAVTAGPVFAPAIGYNVLGAIEVIETPVGGWDGVVNLEDVEQGADQQNDQGLRLSREAEIAAQGTSPVDALRGRLLRVDGVTAVTVFFNNGDSPDADGVPAHSVEAMVMGGDDDEIREILWQSVSAGIRTYGNVSGTIIDSQGNTQTIEFSRPTEIPIYIAIEVEIDESLYPDDGADQIKAAIVAFGNAKASGTDARSFALGSAALDVDGVMTVLEILIDDAPGPTLPDTIPISLRQRATYDTANITVIATPGVP